MVLQDFCFAKKGLSIAADVTIPAFAEQIFLIRLGRIWKVESINFRVSGLVGVIKKAGVVASPLGVNVNALVAVENEWESGDCFATACGGIDQFQVAELGVITAAEWGKAFENNSACIG